MELSIFFSGNFLSPLLIIGLNIDHKYIKIIYDEDGRPSGEAFCILDASEKAE
jgi:hypothetical protein